MMMMMIMMMMMMTMIIGVLASSHGCEMSKHTTTAAKLGGLSGGLSLLLFDGLESVTSSQQLQEA
jgi:uncharacterized membrane protein